ncbi:MAG: aminomethyltransferase family protein [Chloroflexota bacterium]|nr:aminomethyltransferase family protein [Chloroflexota bacterium]MDE2942312.1 aminomethyltransferase family protein [Chloroflexota bacterium]MDE3268284.1 aminomethyltransferase family protein [Chloroflexota bacterium]
MTSSTTSAPLRETQVNAGAEFDSSEGGLALPAHFGDAAREYTAARQSSALLDRSAFGRLRITGADGLDLLNRLSTNKLIDLQPGHGAGTVLTTNKGRIIDLLVVANLGEELLVITSPGTQDKVVEWIDLYTFGEDIAVEDATQSAALLSVVGPQAAEVLGDAVAGLDLFDSTDVELGSRPLRVIRTDALGIAGYDLVVPAEHAANVWLDLADRGAVPIGELAAETVRVEQGVPRFGRELGEDYNPLEAGLLPFISFDKGCYIGQEVVVRLNTYRKVQKRLMGIVLDEEMPDHDALVEANGGQVGFLTSVVDSPAMGRPLALAFVRTAHAEAGLAVEVPSGSRAVSGVTLELPASAGTE